MPASPLQRRQHLNADALIDTLRARFATLPDARVKPTVPLADALLSGFALFALKDPSLLAFDQRRQEPNSNLHTVYGIDQIPCDSQLRDILDPVDPEFLRPCFTDLFRHLQRGKALEPLVFFEGHYLLSFDGSEYFSSQKIHCPHCLEKHHRNGTITYHHQLLAAVLVHPDFREVIPLMPEPILKQDGDTKNDCERNAAKRFFAAFRRDHPCLPVIATGDGLTANAPLIRDLSSHTIRFILGAKPGDHTFLFQQLDTGVGSGQTQVVTWWDATNKTLHHFRWLSQVPLNEANPDVLVNVVEYWEIKDNQVTFHGSWVTDLEVNEKTVWLIMRGGRARWKIENETFNTLKNQGYQFEHNFGHGEQHLSVVFGVLMLLAFLSDQIQQLCCTLFRAVWQKAGSKRQLWDNMRHLFHSFAFGSMRELYEALLRRIAKQKPLFLDDT
jgi:hypothetical protein